MHGPRISWRHTLVVPAVVRIEIPQFEVSRRGMRCIRAVGIVVRAFHARLIVIEALVRGGRGGGRGRGRGDQVGADEGAVQDIHGDVLEGTQSLPIEEYIYKHTQSNIRDGWKEVHQIAGQCYCMVDEWRWMAMTSCSIVRKWVVFMYLYSHPYNSVIRRIIQGWQQD